MTAPCSRIAWLLGVVLPAPLATAAVEPPGNIPAPIDQLPGLDAAGIGHHGRVRGSSCGILEAILPAPGPGDAEDQFLVGVPASAGPGAPKDRLKPELQHGGPFRNRL